MFLTFITFLPLIGALFLVFMPKESVAAIKQTALAVAAGGFPALDIVVDEFRQHHP